MVSSSKTPDFFMSQERNGAAGSNRSSDDTKTIHLRSGASASSRDKGYLNLVRDCIQLLQSNDHDFSPQPSISTGPTFSLGFLEGSSCMPGSTSPVDVIMPRHNVLVAIIQPFARPPSHRLCAWFRRLPSRIQANSLGMMITDAVSSYYSVDRLSLCPSKTFVTSLDAPRSE
jgi:hypothetical protein